MGDFCFGFYVNVLVGDFEFLLLFCLLLFYLFSVGLDRCCFCYCFVLLVLLFLGFLCVGFTRCFVFAGCFVCCLIWIVVYA